MNATPSSRILHFLERPLATLFVHKQAARPAALRPWGRTMAYAALAIAALSITTPANAADPIGAANLMAKATQADAASNQGAKAGQGTFATGLRGPQGINGKQTLGGADKDEGAAQVRYLLGALGSTPAGQPQTAADRQEEIDALYNKDMPVALITDPNDNMAFDTGNGEHGIWTAVGATAMSADAYKARQAALANGDDPLDPADAGPAATGINTDGTVMTSAQYTAAVNAYNASQAPAPADDGSGGDNSPAPAANFTPSTGSTTAPPPSTASTVNKTMTQSQQDVQTARNAVIRSVVNSTLGR